MRSSGISEISLRRTQDVLADRGGIRRGRQSDETATASDDPRARRVGEVVLMRDYEVPTSLSPTQAAESEGAAAEALASESEIEASSIPKQAA